MAGSAQAWLVWYDSVYRYARALAHDPSVAEELVQETYKRALAARKKPGAADSIECRRWLFTITRHLWQNELRQRYSTARMEAGLETAAEGSAESPEAVFDRKLLQSEIHHALDCLPSAHREVLILREIENLSYSDISSILQCPVGTVMSRLARARGLLRRRLLSSAGRPKEWPR